MKRKVTLSFDRDHGSWPFVASTEMDSAPKGWLSCSEASEEAVLAKLEAIVKEWIARPEGYPKTVEVDWSLDETGK